MRIALVANRNSGSADTDQILEHLTQLGANVELFDIAEVERAVLSKPDRLVIAGGDGSIAVVAAAASAERIPLAVIPAGTANDFAASVGIPDDLELACRVAVEGNQLLARDLAWVDGRAFVNTASVGLAVPAARTADRLKNVLGPAAYAAGALRAGVAGRPFQVKVADADDELFEGDAWQVIISNTGTFGGGSQIEQADPSDGLLNATIIEATSRRSLVRRAWGLKRGDVASQAGVQDRTASAFTVSTDSARDWNIDGELLPLGAEAQFTIVSQAFSVIGAHGVTFDDRTTTARVGASPGRVIGSRANQPDTRPVPIKLPAGTKSSWGVLMELLKWCSFDWVARPYGLPRVRSAARDRSMPNSQDCSHPSHQSTPTMPAIPKDGWLTAGLAQLSSSTGARGLMSSSACADVIV